MYPYVRSSTPVLRDMGCTVPVLRDMNVPYYTLLYPYSGTLDVSIRARTTNTPVLRDMGCTAPVLRDMSVPYSTRTPGHWMYPYERAYD